MKIARGHRQPVRLSDCGASGYLDRDIQIPRHPAHHLQLLKILFPEKGHIRLCLQKQLGNHRGHPVEMAGAMRPAQGIGQARNPHIGGKTGGIDLIRIRYINQITAKWCQFQRVCFFGSGIVFQIIRVVELFGIDKNGHDHPVTAFHRRAHKAQMSFMQRAHGRHNRNGFPAGLPFFHKAAQL
jgi:hypothetical protein